MSMDPRTSSLPDSPILPTRRLRWLASVARVLMWIVACFWLMFGASWGLLHGWIVPRISDFRPRLELQASLALGLPVRIGQITAQSNGLIPSFELKDVVLLDPEGREALRLPRVQAALSPASIWNRGFEQLLIDQPVLDIRRAVSGKIFVGGLDMSQTREDDNAAADWFFSQAEFSIRGGRIIWTDELRNAPALALDDVYAVIRNGLRSHQMRLDATPPPQWGERFSLRGVFRQPLLSVNAGRWADWSGQLFGDFAHVDVSRVRQYVDLGSANVDIAGGRGALRAWVDIKSGQVTGATADLALAGVNTQLGKSLQALELDSLVGRLVGARLKEGSESFEFSTQGLGFKTREGLVWPGGNLAITYRGSGNDPDSQLELKADRLDLAALAQIANRLPLGTSTHSLIASYAPRGLVEKIEARLQGRIDAPVTFTAKGRVSGLQLAALAAPPQLASAASQPAPGRPGIAGATIDFDLNQQGGKASVQVAAGALDLPGIFEEPRVVLDKMQMDTQWKRADGQTEVQLRNLRFSAPDAEGSAQASWRSGEAGGSKARSKSGSYATPMGFLDLQGSLSRGSGAKVHRYLPLVLPQDVRHYVRDAVVKGDLSDVRFKVKGPVDMLPFSDPSQGEFKVSAKVKGGHFAYVPAPASKVPQPRTATQWPALTELEGELVFNRASFEVNGASSNVAGLAGLRVKAAARIPDLMRGATVEVNASIKGPLPDALAFVNTSPLGSMTGQVLSQATASGSADYALQLRLPLKAIDKSEVRGTVSLSGNDVQLAPAAPLLAGLKGQASFSESGFAIARAQARVLGGDIRFEGGSRAPGRAGANPADKEESVSFRAQGTLTAEGLKQLKDSGQGSSWLSRMAKNASGGTAYSATLGFRRGVAEVSVSSNLQGMGLSLPAPLGKSAESSLPLRFDLALLPESLAPGQRLHDRISLTLGNMASIVYVRDVSGAEPRVVRGAIGVGLEAGESAPLPETGVAGNINLASVDLDAWEKALSASAAVVPPATLAAPGAGRPAVQFASTSPSISDYLPNRMAIRARELTVEGRKLHRVVVGGTREGLNWRANIDAEELNGYLEFSQSGGAANAGRVYARLSRLSLGQSTASEVESLLDEQPASIPALDIIVDDLELRGRKLGRIEIAAINRGAVAVAREGGAREWRLNKFNVTLPEATLTATGNWVAVNALSPAQAAGLRPGGRAEPRRTVMNFKLDIADSGELLKRFGMKDVIRRGKGKMDGQVGWVGSPLSLDYPSMNGQFNVNIESGQFLKAEPGIAKLLGVLSLQALPRRLALDFRDVFSAGFAFDFVRGDVNINQGVAATNNLQMKGVNAAVLMEGSADIEKETQDLKVVVVPEINAGTASLIASVINPAIGIGTFLAQFVLRQPLIRANTQEFHIDGSWADPKITKVERKP